MTSISMTRSLTQRCCRRDARLREQEAETVEERCMLTYSFVPSLAPVWLVFFYNPGLPTQKIALPTVIIANLYQLRQPLIDKATNESKKDNYYIKTLSSDSRLSS